MKPIEVHNDYLYVYETDLPMADIKQSCDLLYNLILQNTNPNHNGGTELGSATSKVFDQYNILLFPFPGLYELYESIYNVAVQHIDDWSTNYYLQAWMNYYQEGEHIGWHSHIVSDPPAYHGYFYVDAEDSVTSYEFTNGNKVDVPSINGNLIISKSDGDKHRSWPWPHSDRPRITIAFDILPAHAMNYGVNHWMPILKKEN